MHLNHHLAPTVALAIASLLSTGSTAQAQGRHVFDIDSPSSTTSFSGSVTIGGISGPINGNPSTFSTSGATELDLTVAGGVLTSGQFVSGDFFVTVPTLNATVPNILPFLPPLATVTVTGLTVVFRSVDPLTLAPATFAIAPDGSFTTDVVADILSGTANVAVIGQTPETIPLAGSSSDPNSFSGSILSTPMGFELSSNYASTFAFSDPTSGASGTLSINGALVAADRAMAADTTTISLSTGGVQALRHSAGTSNANRVYAVMGTVSGTSPGFTSNGVAIPINADSWTVTSLNIANGAIMGNTIAFLDALGVGDSTISFPPLSPVLIGLSFDHAYVAIDPTTFLVEFASNPVSLTFVP